jgi:hypothetical protein
LKTRPCEFLDIDGISLANAKEVLYLVGPGRPPATGQREVDRPSRGYEADSALT